MISLNLTFLVIAAIVFLLLYKLKLRKRFWIALAVWIIPSLVVILAVLFVGDRPPKTYIYYSGSAHIDPGSVQEKEYRRLVNEAKMLEENKSFAEAIKKYQQALRVNRAVAPSYYVLFDIGRLQYESRQFSAAIATLKSFLSNVEMELRSQKGVKPPPDGFMVADQTQEHLNKLLADKAKAAMLIRKSEAMLRSTEQQ